MVDLLVKLLGPTLYNLGVSEADLISYLTQLEGYIYAIIAAVVVLVAVMFLAHFAKKGFRCAVRLEAFMAFLICRPDHCEFHLLWSDVCKRFRFPECIKSRIL